jgi:hypothetical protein
MLLLAKPLSLSFARSTCNSPLKRNKQRNLCNAEELVLERRGLRSTTILTQILHRRNGPARHVVGVTGHWFP